uniref:Uncharacterized protein n=1 Tax=Entomoneis paludosa TaxID=265537 RepID=A0A7S2V9C6_9STRA|mmetsp:Transcript_12569/g.26036  ORF Transcript_12569/g.26036 Transcript_12569/m.26036 type:complete len:141 (+) Transcript_12569:2-424(+)
MGCTQATALFVARHLPLEPDESTSVQMEEHMSSNSSKKRRRTPPRRIMLDRLEFIDIQAWRDEQGALELPILPNQPPSVPSRLQEITGTILVHSREPLTGDTLVALREQTEWRCPVANMMMESGCKINVEWLSAPQELNE